MDWESIVLRKFPNAYCGRDRGSQDFGDRNQDRYYICDGNAPPDELECEELGEGDTEAKAWRDAAMNL